MALVEKQDVYRKLHADRVDPLARHEPQGLLGTQIGSLEETHQPCDEVIRLANLRRQPGFFCEIDYWHRFPYLSGLDNAFMICRPGGPRTRIKIAGRMKNTSGKINLITVFRAASSAAWLLLSRIVSAYTLNERATLPPISSVWVRNVMSARNSSTPQRSASRTNASLRTAPACIS